MENGLIESTRSSKRVRIAHRYQLNHELAWQTLADHHRLAGFNDRSEDVSRLSQLPEHRTPRVDRDRANGRSVFLLSPVPQPRESAGLNVMLAYGTNCCENCGEKLSKTEISIPKTFVVICSQCKNRLAASLPVIFELSEALQRLNRHHPDIFLAMMREDDDNQVEPPLPMQFRPIEEVEDDEPYPGTSR